jgi:predicted tellurium resistance membrane protein TerC
LTQITPSPFAEHWRFYLAFLAGTMDRFYILKYGLAIVLVFVGLAIVWLNEPDGGKFPITVSRGFIATATALSVLASLLFPRRHQSARTSAIPGAR